MRMRIRRRSSSSALTRAQVLHTICTFASVCSIGSRHRSESGRTNKLVKWRRGNERISFDCGRAMTTMRACALSTAGTNMFHPHWEKETERWREIEMNHTADDMYVCASVSYSLLNLFRSMIWCTSMRARVALFSCLRISICVSGWRRRNISFFFVTAAVVRSQPVYRSIFGIILNSNILLA